MKKLNKCVIAAVLAGAVMLAGCENNSDSGKSSNNNSSAAGNSPAEQTSSLSEKTEKLLSEVDFPEMKEVSEDNLEVLFGISPDDVTDYSVYICPTGAYPDEFGIIVASDADKAGEIKSLLDDRIDYQRSTYEDYTPDEMYKLDDSFVSLNGNTITYAICADNAKAKEILG